MNSEQLVHFLNVCPSLKNCTKIVTCSSELLNITFDRGRATAIIVNTDLCEGVGIHWVAMFIPKKTLRDKYNCPIIDFCDSLAKQAHEYNIFFSRFLSMHCKQVRNNCVKLQSDTTSICGGWCLKFLDERAKGLSMNKYVKSFSINTYKNDQKIQKYLCRKFAFFKNLLI